MTQVLTGNFIATGKPEARDFTDSTGTAIQGFVDTNNNGKQDKSELAGYLTAMHVVKDDYRRDGAVLTSKEGNVLAFVNLPDPKVGDTLTCKTSTGDLQKKVLSKNSGAAKTELANSQTAVQVWNKVIGNNVSKLTDDQWGQLMDAYEGKGGPYQAKVDKLNDNERNVLLDILSSFQTKNNLNELVHAYKPSSKDYQFVDSYGVNPGTSGSLCTGKTGQTVVARGNLFASGTARY